MDGEHHRHFIQSPLIIGLMGVGAGAIVVATYQCLVNSCCFIQSRIAQQSRSEQTQVLPTTANSNGTTRMTISINPSPVHMLPISRYNKERKESTCAVCLSEFTDGEAVRVLPECAHLFHVGCIDMWLHSHSNCPLCRTDIVPRRQQVTFERMEPLTYSDPNSFVGVIPERHVTLERIELPTTMNSNPNSFSQPRTEQHVVLMPHLGVN